MKPKTEIVLNLIGLAIEIGLVVLGFVLWGLWLFVGGWCLYSAVMRSLDMIKLVVLKEG